jgi:hypothetical protein
MQHGDAALELSLHFGIARYWKAHLAEFFVLLSERTEAQRGRDQTSDQYQALAFHCVPPKG